MIHYTLAIAQKETGDMVGSLENLRAFLAAHPTPRTKRFRKPAEAVVDDLAGRVARVTISVSPDGLEGLEVTLDDDSVAEAALGRERIVNPGKHLLKATATGYHEATKSFELEESGTTEVALSLTPKPEPEPEPEVAPAVAAGPDRPSTESEFPTGPVVLMDAGVLTFGVGLTVGLVGVGEIGDAQHSESPEVDAARTKGSAGDVVAGVGAAAAGVGLVWLLLTMGDEPEAETAALRPWVGGPVSGVELRF
jgi:hypothetical protein